MGPNYSIRVAESADLPETPFYHHGCSTVWLSSHPWGHLQCYFVLRAFTGFDSCRCGKMSILGCSFCLVISIYAFLNNLLLNLHAIVWGEAELIFQSFSLEPLVFV